MFCDGSGRATDSINSPLTALGPPAFDKIKSVDAESAQASAAEPQSYDPTQEQSDQEVIKLLLTKRLPKQDRPVIPELDSPSP